MRWPIILKLLASLVAAGGVALLAVAFASDDARFGTELGDFAVALLIGDALFAWMLSSH